MIQDGYDPVDRVVRFVRESLGEHLPLVPNEADDGRHLALGLRGLMKAAEVVGVAGAMWPPKSKSGALGNKRVAGVGQSPATPKLSPGLAEETLENFWGSRLGQVMFEASLAGAMAVLVLPPPR
jgi:hypothetical protein